MIVLIDNHDEMQITNKIAEIHFPFDSWNHIVKESIINTLSHMGNVETEEDHRKLVNMIFDLEDGAENEILPILKEYGFEMEEL